MAMHATYSPPGPQPADPISPWHMFSVRLNAVHQLGVKHATTSQGCAGAITFCQVQLRKYRWDT